MERKKQQTMIFTLIAVVSTVTICMVLLLMTKDYRTKKFVYRVDGFSVRYPRTWTMVKDSGGTSVIFSTELENELDTFKENVNVVTQDLSKLQKLRKLSSVKLDLNTYTRMAIGEVTRVFGDQVQILESSPTFMAGRGGHKLIYLGKEQTFNYKIMHVWILGEKNAYQFTYIAMEANFDDYLDKVEKMIGSFKLL